MTCCRETIANDTYLYDLKDYLSATLFLAKSVDDFREFLEPDLNYGIIAARSSQQSCEQYPNIYVHEETSKVREYSTSIFFKKKLFQEPDLIAKLHAYENVWLYQPYPWSDDLFFIGKNVLSNPFNLYSMLSNKFLVEKIALDSPSDVIKKNIMGRNQKFQTRYLIFGQEESIDYSDATDGYVMAFHSSDGGSHVVRTKSRQEAVKFWTGLDGPIIRCEKYIPSLIPINQAAVVFGEFVFKYPPSVQVIRENALGQMQFLGGDYAAGKKLDKGIIDRLSIITHEFGRILEMQGYKGMFGCDYLADPITGSVYWIELNPRFQASTFLLAALSSNEAKHNPLRYLANPYVLHLASFMMNTCHPLLRPYASQKALLPVAYYIAGRNCAFLKLGQENSGLIKLIPEEKIFSPPSGDTSVEANAPRITALFQSSIIVNAELPMRLVFDPIN